MRALLCSLMALALVLPPQAHAAFTCADLFTQSAPDDDDLQPLRLYRLPGRPTFDQKSFESLRQSFIERLARGAAINTKTEVITPTAKLAFLEAVGHHRGRDIYRFGAYMRNASLGDRNAIARAVAKLDFNEQIGWTRAEKALVKLYMLSHADPSARGIIAMFKTSWTKTELELIRHRLEVSVARRNMVEALADLGIVRNPGALQRLNEQTRKAQSALNLAWSTSMTAISFYFPLFNVREPNILMAQSDAPAAVRNMYIEQGFAAVERDVLALYPRSAATQQILNRVQRVLAALLMPLMLYVLFDDLKELALSAYDWILGNEPREFRDIKLTPEKRAKLIDKIIERDTKIAMILTKRHGETAAQRAERIAEIRDEFKSVRAELEKESDGAIYQMAQ